MLEPNAWAKIPGTSDVRIYPIIRKPSIACSSTVILKTSRQIIIIDPGGDFSQIEHIRRVVTQALKEKGLPVYIFLTHCHTDHFLAMSPLLDEQTRGQLILHEITAHAIEEKDEQITMANMIDVTLPTCSVYARFFETAASPTYKQAQGRARDDREEQRVADTHPFSLEDSRIETPDGRYVLTQSFLIGKEDVMEIFHTPGHSPDGVSYRIGSYFFSGDLHLATTPGIVGLTGWDNVALTISLEALIQKGKNDNIELVIPGHGVPFSFEKAEKIFESVRKEALRLSNLVTLNRARADYLSEYALVLLQETGNIFSIVAARLLKISHYLELLEEESAREILQSIDTDAIDKIVDEFYYFTAELKEGGVPLISKAVQFAQSVDKFFAPEKVSHLFDRFLLRRLKSLLSDFTNAAYGIRFQNQETVFDMNIAVSDLLTALRETPHESESIFDSLEDGKQFITELTKRLAYEPIFSAIQLNFEPSKEVAMVLADRTIFQDMVCALLEQFAISGMGRSIIRAEIEGERTTLKLTEGVKESTFELRDSKLAYLSHSMKIAGGEFSTTTSDSVRYYNFQLTTVGTKCS